MSDLETTQSKLRSTPTAGVAGEHSAYYRRLLSAGYKGYIQGSIGGATLYGALGLIVGGLAAASAAIFAPAALGAGIWMLIPALGGIGALHGAHTFADIGKTAAIIAESADTNEKRRYLLDRYYETPSEEEAKAIRGLLEDQMKPQMPEKMFHWKTVMVGAILGVAFTAGLVLLAASPAGAALHLELPVIAEAIGLHVAEGATFSAIMGSVGTTLLGIGAAVGTLAGGLIGLDREYVRRWLDHAEITVHDQEHTKGQIAAREREVNQLGEASIRDLRQQTEIAVRQGRIRQETTMEAAPAPAQHMQAAAPLAARPDPVPPAVIAGITPTTTLQTPVHMHERIQQAMQVPVL